MITGTIILKKEGHELFIDFIKVFAIICVLLGHLIPPSYLDNLGYYIWMGMQVPLFILIQSFHFIKKTANSFSLKKIITRILFPYILIQIFIFLLYCFFTPFSLEYLLVNKFSWGGFGPGSYYPWVYIQMSLFLYWLYPYLKRNTRFKNLVFFVFICEGFEILFSILDLNQQIYRILAIRYIFLIYLGYLWVEKGVESNIKTIVLSLTSLASCIYFYYFSVDDEPFFYNTAWYTHRWPCYFFVANLMVIILHKLWLMIRNIKCLVEKIKLLSKCTYEIFLVQMAIIPLFPSLSFIEDKFIRFGIRTGIVLTLCIIVGIIWNKLYGEISTKLEKVL